MKVVNVRINGMENPVGFDFETVCVSWKVRETSARRQQNVKIEIALTEEDVPVIAHKAASVVEWTYVPGEPTEEKFIKAILDTDKAGKEFLAKA